MVISAIHTHRHTDHLGKSEDGDYTGREYQEVGFIGAILESGCHNFFLGLGREEICATAYHLV